MKINDEGVWRKQRGEVISTMDGYKQFALFVGNQHNKHRKNILFVTEYVQLKQKMIN